MPTPRPVLLITRTMLSLVVALLCLQVAWLSPVPAVVWAQDQPEAAAPLGRTVTVSGTVSAADLGKVSRIAKALQAESAEKKRPAILILELSDGPSRFGDVRELALFLSDLRGVRTLAYVPRDLQGYNAIIALACQEIVMSPTAMLGNIGRGKAVEDDVRTFVDSLIARRQNPLLSSALAQGMMDPAVEVLWVRRKADAAANTVADVEVMTAPQFERLVNSKAIIEDHRVLKAANSSGLFQGSQARNSNILCSQIVEDRVDLLKIYRLDREALREDPSGGNVIARRIRIEGVITPLTQEFNDRQIQRMLGEGANLLIFEIDSPGGYLEASATLAMRISELDPKQVKTVAYIPQAAHSGAAMIALGCDEIILHPGAQIGDAGPIEIQDGGGFERADEKILSVVRTTMKTLAERKGRPAAVAMAMADKNLNVYRATNKQTGDVTFMTEEELFDAQDEWVKGPRIDDAGNGVLLNVSGQRAAELKIASPPVASFEELKQQLGIPPEESLPAIGPTWVDTLVFTLNSGWVTGLLFFIGILCIYAEMHAPSGLFLIGAVLCFSLFFWSRVLGGTADWLEVILFLIGAGCIAIEIFVVPGVGIFIVTGGLLILFSLIMASQTFFLPTTSADYKQLASELQTLGGSIVGVVLGAAALSRFLPRMKFFDRFILVPPGARGAAGMGSGPMLRPDLLQGDLTEEPLADLLQQRGKAMTILRPSGKARFGDRVVDVVSDGPFIEVDQPVQVIQVNGNRVTVRQLS